MYFIMQQLNSILNEEAQNTLTLPLQLNPLEPVLELWSPENQWEVDLGESSWRAHRPLKRSAPLNYHAN